MRYRLMATYRGVPYEAGIGPGDGDVVLFAACPPPEELGFEPATGHWRKELARHEVQALWESRPMGTFRGERCMVLDDLGDRLHIAYLGHDAFQAERLGYWEVDRGVFEMITPRAEITDIVEDRADFPAGGVRSAAANASEAGGPDVRAGDTPPRGSAVPRVPRELGAPRDLGVLGDAGAHSDLGLPRDLSLPGDLSVPLDRATRVGQAAERPLPLEEAARLAASARREASARLASASSAAGPEPGHQGWPQEPGMPPQTPPRGPTARREPAEPPDHDSTRSQRHDSALMRLATQRVFTELASLAAIPQSAFAVGEEVDGAMCLIQTQDGFEVFNSDDGARHEVRLFEDEESAYFYLFGVLAAEAVRTGRLAPQI